MTSPPRSGRRTGLVIALVVALALVAVLGVSVVRWLDDGDDRASDPPGTSAATPARTSDPSSTSESSPRPSPPTSNGPTEAQVPPKATRNPGRPGWVALRTPDGWSYQVPDDRAWTSAHDVMAYADRGKVLVRATQPSYFNAGACTDPRSVARGVVGWATPDAGKSAAEVATNWATAVAMRDDGSQDRATRALTRPVSNSDMEIERSVVLVRPRAEGCLPRAIKVSAISYRGEGGMRTLVIVRDLGVEGGMSDRVEEQIVRGVRHTPS